MSNPQAQRLASLNGLLWAIGSGLLGSQLITYLAQEYQIERMGASVGLILAAPHFVGVLRLIAPTIIGRLTDRKTFCIGCFVASGIALGGVPLLAACTKQLSASAGITALIVLWCGYNLLEYLGLVALWSWLADIAPQDTRGSFLGRRESWMAAGQAAAMLVSAGLIALWERTHPGQPKGLGYALSAGIGVFFILAAAIPMFAIPRADSQMHVQRIVWSNIFAPLLNRPFLGLLIAGVWLSFTNGLILSPQNIFPIRVLGLSLSFMLCLRVGLRAGQMPIAPAVGKLVDKCGNRLVMAASLVFVAMGPLFYAIATPETYGWIIAAWACWIGWVGYNVGLPNLLLKIAPRSANSSYVALYYATVGLAHGSGSFLGGLLFDKYGRMMFKLSAGDYMCQLNYYRLAFFCGALAYLISAALILIVVREQEGK